MRYEPDVAGALDGSLPALGPSFVASETGRSGLLALVPRDGSEPIILDAGDASIVFHYANAWEEGSRIKIAACAFDRYELGAEYGFDAAGGRFDPSLLLRHDNAWGPFLRLSTVDLAAGTVMHSTTRVHRDFPRVHPRREGRRTNYAYVAAFGAWKLTHVPGSFEVPIWVGEHRASSVTQWQQMARTLPAWRAHAAFLPLVSLDVS